jgi:hypothetical protein
LQKFWKRAALGNATHTVKVQLWQRFHSIFIEVSPSVSTEWRGDFVFSDHARQRMRERSISIAEVRAVLAAPEIDLPRVRGGRVYLGHPGGRFIKVVVATDTDPPTVVTVGD